MGIIWVKAPQISYVNEIVELVKVFYPNNQVSPLLGEDEVIGNEDLLLEAGYGQKEPGSIEFFAFLWRDRSLLCKHRNTQ